MEHDPRDIRSAVGAIDCVGQRPHPCGHRRNNAHRVARYGALREEIFFTEKTEQQKEDQEPGHDGDRVDLWGFIDVSTLENFLLPCTKILRTPLRKRKKGVKKGKKG